MTLAGDSAALSALSEFELAFEFRPRKTTVEIIPFGAQRPVARLLQTGSAGRVYGYRLLTGPDLNSPTGYVTRTGAATVDHRPIGFVNLNTKALADASVDPLRRPVDSSLDPRNWRVEQPGLPPLVGHPPNTSARLVFGRPSKLLEAVANFFEQTGPVTIGRYLIPLTFTFSAASSSGFTLHRHARKARLEVTVHDPRVDRMLVLATAVAMSELNMDSAKRDLAMLAAPFKRRRK